VSDPAVPIPNPEPPPLPETTLAPEAAPPAVRGRALQITLALLIVIVCLELGLFLLVFPWTDYWTSNYFATFIPRYFWVWDSAYFKGAISGLGVVNLLICVSEIFRLRRFAGHS
jgi:hypothetical protein